MGMKWAFLHSDVLALRIVVFALFTEQHRRLPKSNDGVGIGSCGLDIHIVHIYRNAQGFVDNEGHTNPETGVLFFGFLPMYRMSL